jgi:Glycosyl transferases group 1/Glycosyltransferase Family 4
VPTVAIDARAARGARPRGPGRYARELIAALRRLGVYELREDAGAGRSRRLARRRPDLFHGTDGLLPLRRPCPAVVSVHDLDPQAAWRRRASTTRSVRSAELTLCGSAFMAAEVAERCGVDPGALRVVPYAPALALGDAPAPSGPPYLLAVGDLRPGKNLERLVAAFTALRAGELRDHRLVLAGAGKPPPALRAAGVQLTGWLDDARLDALMRGADVVVHPSLPMASASSSSRRWRAASRSPPRTPPRCPRRAATRPSSSTRSTPTPSRPPSYARGPGATSSPPPGASGRRSSAGTPPRRRPRSSTASSSEPLAFAVLRDANSIIEGRECAAVGALAAPEGRRSCALPAPYITRRVAGQRGCAL